VNLTEGVKETNAKAEDFFRWPYSVKICFISSTIGLILLEWECGENLRFALKNHAYLADPWFYPVLILWPWAWSLWVLWKTRNARHTLDKDMVRLMEYVACLPALLYFVAWRWSELLLAASKLNAR